MGNLPCLNCKHAEIRTGEFNPEIKFIRCPYKSEGRWRFYKLSRDYSDFSCDHYEPKEQ